MSTTKLTGYTTEGRADVSGPTAESAPRYTPGPWSLTPYTMSGAHRFLTVEDENGKAVMFLEHLAMNSHYQAMDANANLIALAPELVDALRLCVELLRVHGDMESLGAERFDLTDAKVLKPVFALLARVEAK